MNESKRARCSFAPGNVFEGLFDKYLYKYAYANKSQTDYLFPASSNKFEHGEEVCSMVQVKNFLSREGRSRSRDLLRRPDTNRELPQEDL